MEQNKKILIISQQDEKSTDEVLKYLIYHEANWIRVNDNDIAHIVKINIGTTDTIRFTFGNEEIDLSNVRAVWYRRGKINLSSNKIDANLNEQEKEYYQQYYNYYTEQLSYVYDFIHERLRGIYHINNFQDNRLSKLNQLFVAKKNGFKIPETLVTNSLHEISSVVDQQTQILKAIDFSIFSIKKKHEKCRYQGANSVLLKNSDLPTIRDKYGAKCPLISLYQAYIEKRFEIRTFYLLGKCYSMAIFSQQNEKTKIDFRNYDYENPNRIVPFQLPDYVEIKIKNFMNEMKLNSGSLDILYTFKKEYIFLEVNPIGQFDWLSKACNYFIEKEIAQSLINGSK